MCYPAPLEAWCSLPLLQYTYVWILALAQAVNANGAHSQRLMRVLFPQKTSDPDQHISYVGCHVMLHRAECAVNCAGKVFYGIYYASFYAQYTQLLAAYALAAPAAEEVLGSSPESFQGALAGSGSLVVPQANTLVSGLVQPSCYGALCAPSTYALPPDTDYQASGLPAWLAVCLQARSLTCIMDNSLPPSL